MIIEIYGKNLALIAERQIDSSAVPRVGETITLNTEFELLDSGTELLVHEVTYITDGESFTPLIRCHAASGADNRRMVLEEHGWL